MVEKRKDKNILGSAEILTATVVWGYGYIVIRDSLDTIPLHILMTWRYVIAFFVLVIVFGGRMKKLTKQILGKGAILGGMLYFSQYFQTLALGKADTSAGKVAFITALYVVFVPFLNWIVFRKKPAIFCFLSILLAVPGLYLLTCSGDNGIGAGDILALVGSVGFSVHILAADYFIKKEDEILLTVFQFGFAALFAGIVQIATNTGMGEGLWSRETLWPLIYLGVFSTLIGFFMQLQGQKHLPPEVAAVLLATESVFGMIFSAVLLEETLTLYGKIGCILMLGAILLAEQKEKHKRK